MYTYINVGKMEEIQTDKYSIFYQGFTSELERNNHMNKSKLERIKLGKSIYTVDAKVKNKGISRILQGSQKAVIFTTEKGNIK